MTAPLMGPNVMSFWVCTRMLMGCSFSLGHVGHGAQCSVVLLTNQRVVPSDAPPTNIRTEV